MEPTLKRAVAAVFGGTQEQVPAAAPVAAPTGLKEARERFEEAQQALRKGNWQDFGKAMEQLQRLLQQGGDSSGSEAQ